MSNLNIRNNELLYHHRLKGWLVGDVPEPSENRCLERATWEELQERNAPIPVTDSHPSCPLVLPGSPMADWKQPPGHKTVEKERSSTPPNPRHSLHLPQPGCSWLLSRLSHLPSTTLSFMQQLKGPLFVCSKLFNGLSPHDKIQSRWPSLECHCDHSSLGHFL